MKVQDAVCLVTGGVGGLGAATARQLLRDGARVVVVDLTEPPPNTFPQRQPTFVRADVTSAQEMASALDVACERGELRAVVHCPGRGHPRRILDRDGVPFPLEDYERVLQLNVVGTFNVLRLAAARMASNEALDGERGAIVLTASVAAYEGQIGQIAYASSKAAIVGMTLCAARDLADRGIRVNTIAPGVFDTPLLGRLPDAVKDALDASVPFPSRLGRPDEFAALAAVMLANIYLNGETVRLDGALRMAPR